MILGDPLYFTNSPFSAKSQQNGWAARGELPSYHHLPSAFVYYTVTAASNAGVGIFVLATLGLVVYLLRQRTQQQRLLCLILLAPFVFNVVTLYLGQSVIFIPTLTSTTFEWQLFNVRYGVMMLPTVALLVGYVFAQSRRSLQAGVLLVVAGTCFLFATGQTQAISLQDGTVGLSHSRSSDAEQWLAHHYDGGFVLFDDYARVLSTIRSGIPMQNVITIGNQPYWNESLTHPETYPRWIVMQVDQNDIVYRHLFLEQAQQQHVYKYFQKVYTSPAILIFRRMDGQGAGQPAAMVAPTAVAPTTTPAARYP